MSEALLITTGSVLSGAGLAALTARDNVLLSVLRTFAVAAVVCGVMVQLLPEAVDQLGGRALLAFAVALGLPGLVAPLLSRLFGRGNVSSHGIGAELGYLGFVAHQLAEGLALGTYAGPAHSGHDHGNLVLAVAAHTVPLTAVFVAVALSSHGRRSAAWRTGGLVLATVLGFGAADWIHHGVTESFHGWLSAGVAGFLCHVLLHDPGLGARRTPTHGLLDVLAAAAGVGLPLWAVHVGAGHAGEVVRRAVGRAFGELALETAPMLLLGLALGALLQVSASRVSGRWLASGSAARQALHGIAVGAPLPSCACGVLPIAESLRRHGAGPALVMAFVVATPELGPETLALTVRFFGWPFALVRLAAALLLAFVAAMVFSRIARPSPDEDRDHPDPVRGGRSSMLVPTARVPGGGWRAALAHFDRLLLHTAPWTFVGLLAAAYIEAVIPAESLAPLARTGLDIVVVGLVALPTYVCAVSATPLAAVLLLKGISPGAVLAGLLLGPATNIATLAVLRRGYGSRPVVFGACIVVLLALVLGWLVDLADIHVPARVGFEDAHGHGLAAVGSLAVIGAVLLTQLWRWGPRPWFEILDAGGHGPGHGHRAG